MSPKSKISMRAALIALASCAAASTLIAQAAAQSSNPAQARREQAIQAFLARHHLRPRGPVAGFTPSGQFNLAPAPQPPRDPWAAIATPAPFFRAPIELTPPANAVTVPFSFLYLPSVSCTSAGNCMAVGTYLDSNESIQGMIITETNGVWHQGVEAILPANAAPDTGPFSQIAELDLVTCISAGNCVAAGNYTDTSGNEQFMIVTETGGVWAKGAELSPPPNAGSSPELFLSQITCTSVGNCTAVGGYYDNNNNNDAFGNPRALVISETNGVWGQGVDIVLPANASPDPLKGLGGTQQAAIVAMNEVSCFRPGNCVAVGQYTDTSYNSQLMATTEIDGVWSPAIELTLPANASTAQATQIAILQGLECFKPGDCTAVGVYADIISNIQGLVINQTHGVWGQGVELIPPANAAPALGEVNPLALQCTSRGNCVAIGYYYDPDGNSLPLVVTETGGVWAQGIEPPLSANATNAQSLPGAAINSASCTGPGVCVAVGEYTDNNGNSQPMAYTTVPALSIRTANLPPATAGSYYQAWLWAAGGAGPNIWSVSAGSLPAGLTLNASTGEISGTPAASGTFSFTITVSDTGTSPGQQASAPFTIFVRAGNSG